MGILEGLSWLLVAFIFGRASWMFFGIWRDEEGE